MDGRPSIEVAPLQSEGSLYGFMLINRWPIDTVEWAKFLVLAVQMAAVPGLLLALIDLRCLRLPDRLVGAVAILAGVPSAVLRPERIGPALVAGGLVLTAYLVVALLPRGGLGLGDVKLAAVLATILGFAGWPAVLVGLVVPHVINGPIALALLLTRRGRPIPFGPALLAGALIAVTTA